jgi:hypothetical protein
MGDEGKGTGRPMLRRPFCSSPVPLPSSLSSVNRLFLLLPLLVVAACDGGITGTPDDNAPPTTELSVRAASLVGQVGEADRLSSTVTVSWSGTDPDGFVVAFELRYYAEGTTPPAEQGWTRTTRRDTTILLPISRGSRTANVVFEVRAIDNRGAKDPRPARTVFPIRNSPPTLTLSRTDVPPDTTFTVASFGLTATDPEGATNLARIELALNDSTTFVELPADAQYVTLVGEVDRSNPNQTTTTARVYLGRTFQRTEIRLPGLRLNARNVLYARAADLTDTTSAVVRYPQAGATARWYVKKPRTRVLVVNDYRKPTSPAVMAYHLGVLREHLGGTTPDVWNVETPYVTGSTGLATRSPLLGPTQEPALRETFALFDAIYWVSTQATDSPSRYNLPFAAPAMQKFFDQGGRLLVHSPVTVPQSSADFQDNLDNPALFLLPISRLIPVPDSVRSITLDNGALVRPVRQLPGFSGTLPTLRTGAFILTTLPYEASDSRTFTLYTATFGYQTRSRNTGIWPGPSAAVSYRTGADGQPNVALVAVPVVNEASGAPLLFTDGTSQDGGRVMIRALLTALRFAP